MEVLLCVSAIEITLKLRIKFLDTEFSENLKYWNLGLVRKKKGGEERNLMVTSLLSVYGPSPIGTDGSNQAARGLECWDKRPKNIFFFHPVNILGGKRRTYPGTPRWIAALTMPTFPLPGLFTPTKLIVVPNRKESCDSLKCVVFIRKARWSNFELLDTLTTPEGVI